MADQEMVKIFLRSGAIDRAAPRRERAMRQAFGDDGKLRRDALTGALPWQVRDVPIPGTPPIGVLGWARLTFPAGARIHRLDLAAGTAPSTGSCALWVTVNGVDADTVAIPAGLASGSSGATITVPAGGWLGLRVVATNGAADLMVSIHYTQTGGA